MRAAIPTAALYLNAPFPIALLILIYGSAVLSPDLYSENTTARSDIPALFRTRIALSFFPRISADCPACTDLCAGPPYDSGGFVALVGLMPPPLPCHVLSHVQAMKSAVRVYCNGIWLQM